jgi:hypothetical protein
MDDAGRGSGWPEERVTEFLDEISSAGADYRRLVERLPASSTPASSASEGAGGT